MDKYESKPATIEAMLYDGTEESAKAILDAGEGHVVRLGTSADHGTSDTHPRLSIHTNNGPAQLLVGHYLIKGVSDFYPCDPETFEARWQADDESYVVVSRRADGDWGWTKFAANHRKVGTGGEGLTDKAYAVLAATRENPNVEVRIEEDEG